MEFIGQLIDFILHIDRHLAEITAQYGTWSYAILAAIVFCETGLVVTPLLPGDSLLFAAGALAAIGPLEPGVLNLLLFGAVVAGDNANYWAGRFIGPRAFTVKSRFLNRRYLDRTHDFFERHGGRTVVLARFIPIVRTFTPFVAGIGAMSYPRFLAWSLSGGALWVTLFVWAGYYFGNLPAVRNNFGLVALAIIILSVLPLVIGILRERARVRTERGSREIR